MEGERTVIRASQGSVRTGSAGIGGAKISPRGAAIRRGEPPFWEPCLGFVLPRKADGEVDPEARPDHARHEGRHHPDLRPEPPAQPPAYGGAHKTGELLHAGTRLILPMCLV